MKKLSLFILACGFILPLISTGNFFYKNFQEQAAFKQGHQFFSATLKYSQTEPETIGNHGIYAAGNSYRTQGGLAFLSAADFRLSNTHHSFYNNASNKDNLSFKEYLFHIYPSHNFW